ncbi:Smr domain protein [Thalassovita gelatinovora]|uniref:Smr domain protein n=1 Tax=Thalassovita gelatinovora TaxID=53501 RepID=A0A0P1FA10_THAGE|nr:Smr/MutS family protein [Thalassovita gelatinovora]QIZ81045.1 DNA mismatch repair protein MutS [Thalassovita gelatinovora]CUH65006.1 Smr domain protein [Thalassovita gelatinovora]SEP88074.1 DNA-nicking endonuclease, Smr domain [Thalassovita gelatinovora]
MTRRRLRPEEIELWKKVAETADRMHSDPARPEPKPKPKPKKSAHRRLPDFQIGTRSAPSLAQTDLSPTISEQLDKTPLRMDRNTFGKMRRGKMLPEGRIDLHGMTMDKAHPALNGFIMRSHAQGKRLVLVITGKGKHRDEGGPIPVRFGVLKHNVPQWLSMPPLSTVVLQVTEAHQSHGGGGAYYVYLRRNR